MLDKRIQANPINHISITTGFLDGDDWPMHTHDFNELVIITDGHAMQCINEEKFFISAGDVFVIKGNDKHGFQDAKGLQIFNMGYPNDIFQPLESYLKKLPGFIRLFYAQPMYRKHVKFESNLHLNTKELMEINVILNLIQHEFLKAEDGKEILVPSYFFQIVVILARKFASLKVSLPRCASSLSKTAQYIENHYTEKIKLADLVAMASIPVNLFLKEFKDAFHTSPIQYIIELRIRKACSLLSQKDMSITQIATVVGFEDSNYFSRIFKDRIGLNPSDYRKIFIVNR